MSELIFDDLAAPEQARVELNPVQEQFVKLLLPPMAVMRQVRELTSRSDMAGIDKEEILEMGQKVLELPPKVLEDCFKVAEDVLNRFGPEAIIFSRFRHVSDEEKLQ